MNNLQAAQKIEHLNPDDLIPCARNSRTHSPEQLEQVANSIKEFGFTNPVLIDAENGIIAGHGRVIAAQQIGLITIPCIKLSHLTESQKRAYVIADKFSVWDIPKPQKNDLHPTMKPVALVENCIKNSSKKGMLVADMFLGSGTSVIAAEQTGRVCYGIELSPRYIDVIVIRWQELTGKQAVLESNGKIFNELQGVLV
jgi:hypothetical protein